MSSTSISQAFVLGAGLGTRLKKLTQGRPKPLVPVANRPLITHAFDHLLGAGVSRMVVNTHHCASVYGDTFPDGHYRHATLAFRHEPVLLETGGGIRNVEDLLGDEPFLVYNGDLLSNLPLAPAVAFHLESRAEVTLVLRSGGGPLHIALEPGQPSSSGHPTGHVADIRERLGRRPGAYLFTGIYLVSPRFFRRLGTGPQSVIPTFLAMIEENTPPAAIVIDDGLWHDLGTRETYLDAHRLLLERDPSLPTIHPSARIGARVEIRGATFIGPDAEIGDDVFLENSVLWNGAKIARKSQLTRCVVTDRQSVEGSHIDTDF